MYMKAQLQVPPQFMSGKGGPAVFFCVAHVPLLGRLDCAMTDWHSESVSEFAPVQHRHRGINTSK